MTGAGCGVASGLTELETVPECRRIVLTGGPGGGKSTLMAELRAEDPQAERWLLVPEAARLLLSAGLVQGSKHFQREVVRLQIALEGGVARGGDRTEDGPGRTLICDRGTLDSLAYWRLGGWDDQEFVDLTRMDLEAHRARYDGVIHLQTSAIDAEGHYAHGAEAGRKESLRQATEIDRLCGQAWAGHPRYVLVENAGRDWAAKLQAAHDVLRQWMSTDA